MEIQAAALINWLESLLKQISRREEQAKELYEVSSDRRTLDKLDRLKEKNSGESGETQKAIGKLYSLERRQYAHP